MPLILEPGAHSVAQLLELAKEQREGPLEIRERIDSISASSVKDPASFRTARDLLQDAMEAMDHLGARSGDAAALAAATNIGYSAMLSAIDLMKSHSDVAKVPRATPAGDGPTSGRR